MIRREQLSGLLIGIFISFGFLQTSEVQCKYISFNSCPGSASDFNSYNFTTDSLSKDIEQLNLLLKSLLVNNDYAGSKIIIDKIVREVKNKNIDGKTLSESYYYIGVYYSLIRNVSEAIRYLNLCISLKESTHEYDKCYGNALYNLGVTYSRLGDFKRHEDYSIRSIEVEKKIFGSKSPVLVNTYSSLIIAYIELQEYEKSLNFANIALSIADSKSDSVNSLIIANLYNNMGVINLRLADYTKAKLYLEKSESIYNINNLPFDENYINLMNNLAVTFSALNLDEESDKYYNKGISLAVKINSAISYNIVNSYAISLGNKGKEQKGELLLSVALDRAKIKSGDNSRSFYEVLTNYADYLREYKINNRKSIECYLRCIDYLNKNPQDHVLKIPVYTGYSLSLSEAGEPFKALETIQALLISIYGKKPGSGNYDNPEIESIKTDKKSLKILKAKYKILWDVYKQSSDEKVLEAASHTAEFVILLIEKLRINISEEESRLVLGDKYRDSYLNAIRDFNLLYSKTGAACFLEKAFEYSEKSKVAGLLTSTRELKATQFHIPSEVASVEKNLQRNISLFNARIAEEVIKGDPDTILLDNWTGNLFETTRLRDSLILVFEQQYPDYYAIKYNTKVVGLSEMSEIVGRNHNYINYIVSDTLIYIFIANRIHQKLIALPVDSGFFDNIRQFRSLLAMPKSSENARLAFENYKISGYRIYKTLIDPIRKYLISDKLLISPDNILSYLPFETLPTNPTSGERMLYRDIAYLMNDFDISYTYSATFMAESVKRDYSMVNKVIAFAPDYPDPIDIKSLLKNRQAEMGMLSDLPFARQEAEYVAELTGGKLYENDDAKESVFKAESGKYDIIHLAMHTVLNDTDPMYSTLIFSPENDIIDDRYLKTYEVYGIPLRAKMVVLSSCNTGTGFLFSGEGILSLARSFIYSGGQSVVMSMWEIEDRSGTEIVKMFYKNLIKGNSKSMSLRKARIDYLKNTDQLRAHPYFWSTLIIYGNNAPLYYSRQLISVIIILGSIIGALLMVYYIKRKYS